MLKNEEYNQWGLHNYVISLQIKCRMMEDTIDLAQRLQLKPDWELEKKLEKLKHLRNQVFADLEFFINDREKVHWRNWDHYYQHDYKPDLVEKPDYFKDRCDCLLLQIEFVERTAGELASEITQFNNLNADCIRQMSAFFGNDRWLQFWQLRQLRRQQMKQTSQVDPSPRYLHSLLDPKEHLKYLQEQAVSARSGGKKFELKDKDKKTAGTVETPLIDRIAAGFKDPVDDDIQRGLQTGADEHGPNQTDLGDVAVDRPSDKPFVPRWSIAIDQERKEKELREKEIQQARIARL